MERIVVTTDFSDNSKAGIMYAINLATARNAELVVLHIYSVLRAVFWSDAEYDYYKRRYKDVLEKELTEFIRPLQESMNLPLEHLKPDVYHNLEVVDGILEYASTHECSYICISTRGAGGLKKLFGTNTSNLIIHSKIPVLCVPHAYTYEEIKHVLYLTDMTDYETELSRVVAFATPLKSYIEMLHFYYSYEFVPDKEIMDQTLKKAYEYDVHVQYRARDTDKSMLEEINEVIKELKPSLIIMFTSQKKSFFEKILMLSNATTYSFYGEVPLLTFNKNDK